MSNEISPKFFLQIPIFLNGLGLKPVDKLIFGEIYTMLNVNGKCFMSNKKLADGAEVSISTASHSVSRLVGLNLLKRNVSYKSNSKEIDKRWLTFGDVISQTMDIPIVKNDYTPLQATTIPLVKDNHTPLQDITRGIVKDCKENRLLNRLDEYTTTDSESENFQNSSNQAASNNSKIQEFRKVQQAYEGTIGMMSSYVQQDILKWLDDLSGDLVIEAIKRADANNVHNWKYVGGILKSWANNNVNTFEAVKANDTEFNNKKRNTSRISYSKPNNKGASFKPGDYTEMKRMADNGEIPF